MYILIHSSSFGFFGGGVVSIVSEELENLHLYYSHRFPPIHVQMLKNTYQIYALGAYKQYKFSVAWLCDDISEHFKLRV